ncbi:MAG: MFS transporter, partial [Chloroflexota bacterium]
MTNRSRGWEALRYRDFRLLWSAEVISMAGSQLMRTALAWQIFELTRDPLQLGLLGLSRFVPLLIFGLWGGVIADRGDRRMTLIQSQAVLAGLSLVLAGLTITGRITPAWIYGVTMAAAAVGAIGSPTRQALIPALVPRDLLAGAMTMNSLAYQIGAVAGPALGGVLLATIGVGPIYAFDALTFLVVIAAAVAMRARPELPTSRQGGVAAIREGLRFLWATPILLGVMGLDFLATFWGQSNVLMPIFASDILGGGPRTLGLLLSAPAAGSLAGSAVLAAIRIPHRPGLGVLGAVAAYGLCTIGFGLSDSLPVALLFLAGGGAADAASMAMRHTVRTMVTPDDLRGRIAAAHSTFAMGGPQLGEFEAGLVASWVGASAAVSIGGAGVVLSTVLVAWLV